MKTEKTLPDLLKEQSLKDSSVILVVKKLKLKFGIVKPEHLLSVTFQEIIDAFSFTRESNTRDTPWRHPSGSMVIHQDYLIRPLAKIWIDLGGPVGDLGRLYAPKEKIEPLPYRNSEIYQKLITQRVRVDNANCICQYLEKQHGVSKISEMVRVTSDQLKKLCMETYQGIWSAPSKNAYRNLIGMQS